MSFKHDLKTAASATSKTLMITDEDIALIDLSCFSDLLSLTLLLLSRNKIQQIRDGAFDNLPKLKTLVLDCNTVSATSISVIALCCLIVAILKCKPWPKCDGRQARRNCCCQVRREFQDDVLPNNPCQNAEAKLRSEKEKETKVIFVDSLKAGRAPAEDGGNTLPCDLDMSLKARGEAREQFLRKSYFICLHCLVQSPPPCLSSITLGYDSQSNEEECRSDGVRRTVTDPRGFGHPSQREGVNTTILEHLTNCSKGLTETSSTKRRDIASPRVSESELRKVHRPLPEMEGCRVKYQQIFRGRGGVEKPRSVKMKTQALKPSLCAHQSRGGVHVVLLDESENISLQPENDLICKYTDCDKLGDRTRRTSEERAQNVKFEEQKIQIDDTEGNSFLNDDNKLLSGRVHRTQVPKNVGFYIPNFEHDLSAAGVPGDSREAQPGRLNPRSKYLLKLHSRPGRTERSEDVADLAWGLSSQKVRKKEQDYLTVKVNLQPFRNKRIHPHRIPTGGGVQLHKRHHNASKANSRHDEVVQTKYVNVSRLFKTGEGSEASEDRRGPVSNSPASENISASQDKRGKKTGKKDLLPADTASIPSLVSRSEKTDNVLSPQTGISQRPLESASAKPREAQCSNTLSEERSLKSKVDHKGQISTEPSRKHAERTDPEIQSGDERLTENKPSTKCESADKPQTLSGNVLDTSLSAIVRGGISEEIDFLSTEDNASCEIDPGGFSSPSHDEAVEYFQDSGASHDKKPDGLCRDNNSIADSEINKATDKRVNNGNPLNNALLADPSRDKTTGKAEAQGVTARRTEREVEKETEFGDGEHDGTILSAERSAKIQKATSKENVQAGDVLEENTLENSNSHQQQNGQKPPEDGEKLCAHRQLGCAPSGVKEDTFERQSQDGDTQKSKSAKDIGASARGTGENNSNNNQGSYAPPTEAGRQRLGLSQSSKVVIILENIRETINIQKYLSERAAKQSAPGSSSGDGSQRKKICLVVPEKSDANVSKSTHRKIK